MPFGIVESSSQAQNANQNPNTQVSSQNNASANPRKKAMVKRLRKYKQLDNKNSAITGSA